MESDYKERVRKRILDHNALTRAVFSGGTINESLLWQKVQIRPVDLKGKIHLQFSYFDEKKDITKNYLDDAASKVDELLALPFRNIFVESRAGNIQVNISKKGKAVMSEAHSAPASKLNLGHDRQKNRILNVDNASPFLKAVGIMTKDGRIKADMQRKFKQINEFLRLLEETNAFTEFQDKPIRVVDFGCGSAHLTFAVYYYLRHVLNLDAHVTGVDIKADLIKRHGEQAKTLGWDQIDFHSGYIADYTLEIGADVVIALHACDTATDDALAKGIQWESKLIVCAPCCHHDLQEQMARASLPNPLLPIFQHNILFERIGDILTDTFRAGILRIMGYRTDITEFIPIEHTARNLMIRAVKASPPGEARWKEEYQNLKSFWGLTPYLETKLGDSYTGYFSS